MVRDILSRSPAWDEGRGLSYPLCLLMKPVLRLRLHATQSQPCFPAVSNALALPGGNGIFAATPTERITHYTLQARLCAKGRRKPPFGNPRFCRCVATDRISAPMFSPHPKPKETAQTSLPSRADLCRFFIRPAGRDERKRIEKILFPS